MTTLHTTNSERWLSFYNASGEDIPGYGVFCIPLDKQVPTTELERLRLVANKYDPKDVGNDPSKPDEYGGRYERLFAINGKSAVAPGRWGRCTFAFDGPAWARWRPSEDTTISDDRFPRASIELATEGFPYHVGPYPGKWGMSRTGFGFEVLRIPEPEDTRIMVRQLSPYADVRMVVKSFWVSGKAVGVGASSAIKAPYSWAKCLPEYALNGPDYLPGTPSHRAIVAVRFDQNTAGFVLPGMTINVRYRAGLFQAVNGGCYNFFGAKATKGAMAGETAEINLGYPGGYTYDSEQFKVLDFTCGAIASDSDMVVPYGSLVDAVVSKQDNILRIVNVHCGGNL